MKPKNKVISNSDKLKENQIKVIPKRDHKVNEAIKNIEKNQLLDVQANK